MKLKILFALMMLSIVSSPAQAQKDNIIYIPDHDWAPYFYEDDQKGERPGFAMEMISACLTRMDYTIRRIPSSIKRTEHMLKYGKADLWVMSYRKGREKWLHYSDVAVFKDGYAMFARQDYPNKDASLGSIIGHRVGSLLGVKVSKTYQAWKKLQPEERRPKEFASASELLEQLLKGNVDVAINSIEPFLQAIDMANAEGKVVQIGEPLRDKPYRVVLSRSSERIKNMPEFLSGLNGCLNAYKGTRQLQMLKEKYFRS